MRSPAPERWYASADPGALVAPALAEGLARELHDCKLVKLGSGVHLLQEDHPETIGRSVAAFITEVERPAPRPRRRTRVL
jgi:haloalkane dehalogenase